MVRVAPAYVSAVSAAVLLFVSSSKVAFVPALASFAKSKAIFAKAIVYGA